MKKFIFQFFLFILPMLIFALGTEYYLLNRVTHNEILAKKELLVKQPETKLIFVGNSHGRNAFDPNLYLIPSINLCIGGSTIIYDIDIIKESIDKLPHLKNIVYNISYQSLYYDLEKLPDTKKKYEFYHYLGTEHDLNKFSLHYYSVFSVIGLKSAIESIYNDFFSTNQDFLASKGYLHEKNNMNSRRKDDLVKERVKQHHSIMSTEKNAEHLSMLTNLQMLCTRKKINLTFVVLPVTDMYYELAIPTYLNFVNELKSIPNSAVIELNEFVEFDDSDFIDPDHLNVKGAIKVNRYINEKMSFEE